MGSQLMKQRVWLMKLTELMADGSLCKILSNN